MPDTALLDLLQEVNRLAVVFGFEVEATFEAHDTVLFSGSFYSVSHISELRKFQIEWFDDDDLVCLVEIDEQQYRYAAATLLSFLVEEAIHKASCGE